MNKFFTSYRLGIKVKIRIGFYLLICLISITGVITYFVLNRSLSILNDITENEYRTIQLILELEELVKDSKAYTTNWVYVGSYEEDKERLKAIHTTKYEKVRSDILREIEVDSSDLLGLKSILDDFDKLVIQQKEITARLSSPSDYEDAMTLFFCEELVEETIIPQSNVIDVKLDKIVSIEEAENAQQNVAMAESFRTVNSIIIILGSLGVAISLIVTFLLIRSISAPIKSLKEKIDQLGKGGIPEKIPKITSDEIGDMSMSVNALIDGFHSLTVFAQDITDGELNSEFEVMSEYDVLGSSLLSMRDSLSLVINDTNDVIQQAGKDGNLNAVLNTEEKKGAWKALSHSINHLLKSISTPVLEINKVLSAMADGDLTRQYVNDAKGDIQQLKNNLNSSLVYLNELMTKIQGGAELVFDNSESMQTTSEEMSNATSEISAAINDVSIGAQEQVNKIDEVSKLIENIGNSSTGMEQKAMSINEIASNGLISAEKGKESVANIVQNMQAIYDYSLKSGDSMNELLKRSEEITRVLNVMNEITSKTSLLALNAAIEAAHAGESGRGFAVVAEEIGKLAESSKRSANEIGQLIESIIKDTDKTAEDIELMHENVKLGDVATKASSDVFQEIFDSAEKTLTESKEIVGATKLQMENIKEVILRSESIVVIAEETATGSDQIATSSGELATGMNNYKENFEILVNVAEGLLNDINKLKLTA